MNQNDGFYTLKGYSRSPGGMTSSMEDYLEMICRIQQTCTVVRVNELAEMLHVNPSSASKMVGHLKRQGYVDFEKYGYIRLTEKGRTEGRYLIYRHKVLHEFLCVLNKSDDQLEQAEKLEHFVDKTTVENLRILTERLKNEDKK